MFCKKCGNVVEEGEKFCGKCGAPVEQAAKPAFGSSSGKMGSEKIAMIGASVLMILSTVLPYLKVDPSMVRYVGFEFFSLLKPGEGLGDGIFLIILAVLAIVFVCVNKKWPAVISSAISILLSLYEIFGFGKIVEESGEYSNVFSKGIGYYLQILAVIALLAAGVFYIRKKD